MKRFALCIIMVLVFVNCIYTPINAQLYPSKSITEYSIHEPYVYPVSVGSDEWNSMSIEEKVASCMVDSRLAKEMDSSALLTTVLTFPFIINIGFYNSVEEGVSIVSSYFSPLAELLEREDAADILTEYVIDCNNNGNISDINYVIDTKYNIAVDLLRVYNEKMNPHNYQKKATEINTRYYVDPVYGFKYDYVDTPQGSSVFVYFNLSWTELSLIMGTTLTNDGAYAYSVLAETTYNATKLRNPRPDYNCHSYALYSTNLTNHYWMDNPLAYYNDGSYHVTVNLVAGRKVRYVKYGNNSSSRTTHSAIISAVSGSNVTVKSKWGCAGLFSHDRYNCPYYADEIAQGYSVLLMYYYLT